jgi:hypothetical protein
MIITKLQGGLGNQLFQWATTRNLSLKYNTEYFFDLNHIPKSHSGVTSRGLDIDKFEKLSIKPMINKPNLPTMVDKFIYYDIPDNSYLDGYWQSEKYFKENELVIREELSIPHELKTNLIEKYPFLKEETIAIHVRRGDYLHLSNYHPVQTVEYYKTAYDLIGIKNINVVIVSDDIQWCKNNLNFENTHFIENESNICDLYIMSICTHNIISSSTFSWWGAWLNGNPNKKVIIPDNWFGLTLSSSLSSDDIYCENWIRL